MVSSKTTHSIAGFCVGGAFIYLAHPSPFAIGLILVGSQLGASAPDWLEIAHWRKQSTWFGLGPDKGVRESVIPHRTITHTLLLWVIFLIYSIVRFITASQAVFEFALLAFAISGLTHLLLDIRTVMGIPLLPFGKRYHLNGLKLEKAHKVQRRSGWI